MDSILNLKIKIVNPHTAEEVVKTIQLDVNTIVFDACRQIVDQFDIDPTNVENYGLFQELDNGSGMWLEIHRTLEHYMLKSGSVLEYRKRVSPLTVHMIDGSTKNVMVDKSNTVGQLLNVICAKLGINNSDEYSLTLDLSDEDKFSTMKKYRTLDPKATLSRDQKKMDKLQKKLHTDDELNWLDASKTLAENGCNDKSVITFRRRYFFSDRNIGTEDPVQMNLLYIQTKDAVIHGMHPVSEDEAVQLGSMQIQVELGDHVPSKHKPGLLNLKDVLPKEYVKTRGIEKRILSEHANLSGLKTTEAQAKYVKFCRSLKTYGITFYLVKRKMASKNKLLPSLLGVTKDALLVVDAKSKEIEKVYPLTQVRRTACNNTSFAVDLGDYADRDFTVATNQGEEIRALVNGYIDINLKKKRAADRFGMEGDDDASLMEDTVSPQRATYIQHQQTNVGHTTVGNVALPGVMRPGTKGVSIYSTGSFTEQTGGEIRTSVDTKRTPGSKGGQKALLGFIDDGFDTIESVDKDLSSKGTLPTQDTDPSSLVWRQSTMTSSRRKVHTQLAAISSATSKVLTQLTGDDFDPDAMSAAVSSFSSNLQNMCNDIRLISALAEDDEANSDSLLRAARNLTSAFGDLLRAAQPENNVFNENDLKSAASRIGQAGTEIVNILNVISVEKELSNEKQMENAVNDIDAFDEQLISNIQTARTSQLSSENEKQRTPSLSEVNQKAGTIGYSLSKLVSNAAMGKEDNLGSSSTEVTSALKSLLSSIEGVAAGMDDGEDQRSLIDACRNVMNSTKGLLLTAQIAAKDPSNQTNQENLKLASKKVSMALRLCISALPGQPDDPEALKVVIESTKRVDNTKRNVEASAKLLDNPRQQLNNKNYFECLDGINEKSKKLVEGINALSLHAKSGDLGKFGEQVDATGDSVCGLTETTAQVAYLIGMSDPASTPGKPGLVDLKQFAIAASAIRSACDVILSPQRTQSDVLQSATVIAKHTTSLCNSCRVASSHPSCDPAITQLLINHAKDLASGTASLVRAVKKLPPNPTDEDRDQCGKAAQPLLTSVDDLVALAENTPILSGSPGHMSERARAAQRPVVDAGRYVTTCYIKLIDKSKSLNQSNAGDQSEQFQDFSKQSVVLTDAVKSLVSSVRMAAPGQAQLDAAIMKLNNLIRTIGQASIRIADQRQPTQGGPSLQACEELLAIQCRALQPLINDLQSAAKTNPERLASLALSFTDSTDPLIQCVIDAAAQMPSSDNQMRLIDYVKTVAECAAQLLYAVKEGGGNPLAVHTHLSIDNAADNMRESLTDMLQLMADTTSQVGIVSGLVDNMKRALDSLQQPLDDDDDDVLEFPTYQTDVTKFAKIVAHDAQDLVPLADTDVTKLGPLAQRLSQNIVSLMVAGRGCTSTSGLGEDLTHALLRELNSMGEFSINLVQKAGSLQMHPNDRNAKRELAEISRNLCERVAILLKTVQSGAKGIQACNDAVLTVSGIVSDLDLTIVFAAAGSLTPPTTTTTFADQRDPIMQTARALVEETKKLVAGANQSQDELADCVNKTIATVRRLTDEVKSGASYLGADGPEPQVMMLNAVRDVAMSLGDVVSATKMSVGKPADHPANDHLKETAKTMILNVTALLKTVKTMEDTSTRGLNAFVSALSILQQAKILDDSTSPIIRTSADELLQACHAVTYVTTEIVSAGNSAKQEDLLRAGNRARKTIMHLMTTCRNAAFTCEDKHVRQRTLNAGKTCSNNFTYLMRLIVDYLDDPNSNSKQDHLEGARAVASSLAELRVCADEIQQLCVDEEEVHLIAENELLKAAESIEAAAKRLKEVRPKPDLSRKVNQELSFGDQISEAAEAIANAVAALIKAAKYAQDQLVRSGQAHRPECRSRTVSIGGVIAEKQCFCTYILGQQQNQASYAESEQWSQGLVSAAKLVAASTHHLVEAANEIMLGIGSREKLISATKQIASNTAHLLMACQVKAGPYSGIMDRLKKAGDAVKNATDSLVESAQSSLTVKQEETVTLSGGMVGGIAQEMMAQEAILRKENELKEARLQLEKIRKARYQRDGVNE